MRFGGFEQSRLSGYAINQAIDRGNGTVIWHHVRYELSCAARRRSCKSLDLLKAAASATVQTASEPQHPLTHGEPVAAIMEEIWDYKHIRQKEQEGGLNSSQHSQRPLPCLYGAGRRCEADH